MERLRAFSKLLSQLESLLGGWNYAVTLDVKVVDEADAELSLFEVMRRCYPESEPNAAKVRQVSLEEMRTEIDTALGYEGDKAAGPQFTPARRKKLEQDLLPAYWQRLSELISLQDAEIHEYPSAEGLPGYSVFWFFAYVLHDRRQRRWVVIMGSSSD